MKFRTQYERIKVYTYPGEETAKVYDLIVDNKGNTKPEVVEKVYIPDKIDSYRDSTDINVILARYRNGETEVLNARNPQYFDASGMPTTLAEMYAFVENSKSGFEQLPLKVREAYNMNFGEFINDFGSVKMDKVFMEAGLIPVEHLEKKEGENSGEPKQGD